MVNELIGLQLITVIWKPEGGDEVYSGEWKLELIGLQLITVIWKPEGGERIDRFTADYCDMET